MSLVPLVAGHCPNCGIPVDAETVDQPALFLHGGYGGTRRTVTRFCVGCGWELRTETSERSPR